MPIDPRRYAMTPEGRTAERLADTERRVSLQERLSLSGVAKQLAVLTSPTTTTIPNATNQAVSFNAPSVDNMGAWNAGQPSRLTASRTGVYIVTGHVAIAGNPLGDRQANLQAGGDLRGISTPAPANQFQAALSGFYILDEGEYVELTSFQDSGGALALNDAGLAIAWLGVGAS